MTYYVKLTNRCNLRCRHCYNAMAAECGGLDMSAEMQSECAKYIYDSMPAKGPVSVVFHGGEPMCATDACAAMNRFMDSHDWKNPDLQFNITTNLVYPLNDHHIDLFRRFRGGADGHCSIATSWDEGIRFADDSERWMWEENVVALRHCGVDVFPIVCVTRDLVRKYDSKSSLECLFRFFRGIGVTSLNFERITETGRAAIERGHIKPCNRDTDHWLARAYEAAKSVGMHIPLFDILEDAVNGDGPRMDGCRCRMCTKCVRTINPNGTVAGCPNRPDILAGRIVDGTFVPELSFNDEVRREEIHPEQCYECELHKWCNAECYQLGWDVTGCPGLVCLISNLLAAKEKTDGR